jgi:hypothetical protein
MLFFIVATPCSAAAFAPTGVMAAPNISALNIRRQVPGLLLFFGPSRQIPD